MILCERSKAEAQDRSAPRPKRWTKAPFMIMFLKVWSILVAVERQTAYPLITEVVHAGVG